jgi:hypothetical protein
MSREQKPETEYERRLRAQLKAIVAERSEAQAAEEATDATATTPAWRRRGPRLALGGGIALAAVATALIASAGSDKGSTAYAVETQDGGGVTIRVYSAEDAAGLEGALAEAGIRSQVTWLAAGMRCREPHFTPSTAKTSLGGTIGGLTVGGPAPALTIGVMSVQQWRERSQEFKSGEISEDEYHASTANISLDPEDFRPDQTVVISGSPGPYEGDPQGGYEAQVAIAEGPVEPCEPVRVPDGGILSEMNRVLESESAPGQR